MQAKRLKLTLVKFEAMAVLLKPCQPVCCFHYRTTYLNYHIVVSGLYLRSAGKTEHSDFFLWAWQQQLSNKAFFMQLIN